MSGEGGFYLVPPERFVCLICGFDLTMPGAPPFSSRTWFIVHECPKADGMNVRLQFQP